MQAAQGQLTKVASKNDVKILNNYKLPSHAFYGVFIDETASTRSPLLEQPISDRWLGKLFSMWQYSKHAFSCYELHSRLHRLLLLLHFMAPPLQQAQAIMIYGRNDLRNPKELTPRR